MNQNVLGMCFAFALHLLNIFFVDMCCLCFQFLASCDSIRRVLQWLPCFVHYTVAREMLHSSSKSKNTLVGCCIFNMYQSFLPLKPSNEGLFFHMRLHCFTFYMSCRAFIRLEHLIWIRRRQSGQGAQYQMVRYNTAYMDLLTQMRTCITLDSQWNCWQR